MGVPTCTVTLETSVAVYHKIGNQPTSRPSDITLNIYPKDTQSYHKNTCSTLFIVTLIVIVRLWKKLRCPSTDELIKNVVHLQNGVLYSCKNNDIIKFVGKWMEKNHCKWGTPEPGDKHSMYSFISGY